MKANDWFTRIGGVVVSLAILVGCESEPTKQIRPVTTSGFLGDYSMLREGGEGEAALVYVNPTEPAPPARGLIEPARPFATGTPVDKADACSTLWIPFSQLIRCPRKRIKSNSSESTSFQTAI